MDLTSEGSVVVRPARYADHGSTDSAGRSTGALHYTLLDDDDDQMAQKETDGDEELGYTKTFLHLIMGNHLSRNPGQSSASLRIAAMYTADNDRSGPAPLGQPSAAVLSRRRPSNQHDRDLPATTLLRMLRCYDVTS